MKKYVLSKEDVVAIKRIVDIGGNAASLSRDSVNFEAGVLSDSGYLPVSYGSGDTIADAINEAIGVPPAYYDRASSSAIIDAINWLRKQGVSDVYWEG